MRFIVTTLVFITLIFKAYSQQPDIAHVVSLPLEINPAYAGSYNQYRVGLLRQEQLIKYENHPVINGLSADMPINSINSGLGFVYFNDNFFTGNTNIGRLAYSYNLNFNKIKLNIGTGVNYLYQNIDFYSTWNKPFENATEEHIKETLDQLSMSLGVFLYTEKFYLSISYNDFNIINSNEYFKSFKDGFYFISGYHFFKGGKISLCTSIEYRYIKKGLSYLNPNLKLMLANKFWITSTLSTKKYLEFGIGINVWKLYGGISYTDYMSDLNKYGDSGFYELILGLHFDKKE